MNRPELGYSWNYQIGRLLSATVYVYNLSIQAIPDGPSSPGRIDYALITAWPA